MGDWISDLLLFSAGITGGILVPMIKPILSAAKRRRTELVAAVLGAVSVVLVGAGLLRRSRG